VLSFVELVVVSLRYTVFVVVVVVVVFIVVVVASNYSLSVWNSVPADIRHITDIIWPFSSLPNEMPPHFPFLGTRSHFHAHNCCTVSLSLSM